MPSLTIRDLISADVDDPVVWQRGKMLPDGRIRVWILRESDQRRLVAAFGGEWLANHLAEKERELAQWGVH